MPPSILATTSEVLAVFLPRVKLEEGLRLVAYRDSRGLWTIGYGRHDAGVTPGLTCTAAQAEVWLVAKAAAVVAQLDAALPWWRALGVARAEVLLDMAFNMGLGVTPCAASPKGSGLRGFPRFLAAARAESYLAAAGYMLASAWRSQVGVRAVRLAAQMKSGVVQPSA